MASTIIASGDIQVVCERARDKESAAGFAQVVHWQARAIGKAGTPIERVKNGRIAADIEGKLHLITAVTNDVAEQLAKNKLGSICIHFGCPVVTQHANDSLPGFGSCLPILHGKTPTGVTVRQTRWARHRNRRAFDANRKNCNVVQHFVEDMIAYGRCRILGIPYFCTLQRVPHLIFSDFNVVSCFYQPIGVEHDQR